MEDKKMSNDQHHNEPEAAAIDATPDRAQRWLKYGVNVALMIVATVAIVFFINFIGYRHFVRFDFTETRQYSLSPQTMKLLESLDRDVQITSFYSKASATGELLEKVDDLVGEYQRRSPRIEATQIDPAFDIAKRDAFFDQLMSRFGTKLNNARATIDEASAAFDAINEFAAQQVQELPSAAATLPPTDTQAVQLLQQLARIFMRLGDDLKSIEDQIEQTMNEPMPNLSTARTLARDPLRQVLDQVLNPAVTTFDSLSTAPTTSNATKDVLLGLKPAYEKLKATVSAANTRLNDMDLGDYVRVRNDIFGSNCVVVSVKPEPESEKKAADESSGDGNDNDDAHGVAVITLDDLYPNVRRSGIRGEDIEADQGYKGEETITGAILRLTVKNNTKIVFINPTPQPVLNTFGQQGGSPLQFADVVERLEKMNFEVTEWQPGGSAGPFGQPMPAGPKPTPGPGERMIYIGLPAPPPNPQAPQQPAGPQAAEAIRSHLAAGHPALIFAQASSLMTLGQPDPMIEPLSDFGINIDTSRVVMTSVMGAGGREQVIPNIQLNEWTADNPVTRAARGLRGIHIQAMPVTIAEQLPEGVKAWPLITTPKDTWADTDYMARDAAKRDESDPRGPFTTAAIAEKGDTRVAVIADPVFASDMVTTYGVLPGLGGGAGLAELAGAEFPANAELFVNTIYWLAGMDEWIAPGARTQDIRRIGAMTATTWRLLFAGVVAGIPLLCLGAGIIVWVMRRQ